MGWKGGRSIKLSEGCMTGVDGIDRIDGANRVKGMEVE
jgi:hypothetical protein